MAKPVKYGHVKSGKDIERINDLIRQEVQLSKREASLTKLYRRSAYLATLAQAPAWSHIAGAKAKAKSEFHRTATLINSRAKALGIDKRYDTKYGRGE